MLTPEFARQLERVFRTHHGSLIAYLSRRFPRVDRDRIADAVSDAYVAACAEPARFEAAGRQGGDSDVVRLLRTASWRALRGWYRRSSTKAEVTRPRLPERSTPIDLEQRVVARQELADIRRLVGHAARKTCSAHRDALEAALTDRLAGDSDAEAARRHGVPREYVNRARRWMLAKAKGNSPGA